MITNVGKTHIKRYLASLESRIASSVVFGIGGKVEAIGDTSMHFETERFNVSSTGYDFTANKLIFKAEIPDNYNATVYEVGIYNTPANPKANHALISTFSSNQDVWSTNGSIASFVSTNTRMDSLSLQHTPAASGTTTSTLANLKYNGFSNIDADNFILAFYNGNTNTNTVTLRLKTDASNYFQYVITNPASGYLINSWTRGSMTTVGTPNWSNLTSFDIITNAKSAGAASIQFDALRINDSTNSAMNDVLVSRKLLTTPFVKQSGKVQEIEFTMDISI